MRGAATAPSRPGRAPSHPAGARGRALRLGLALGLLAPLVGAGALSALMMALVQQPFASLGLVGRWTVFPAVSGLGIAIALWLCAAPPTAALWLGFGRWWARGPAGLPDLRAAVAAAVVAAPTLAAAMAAFNIGGPARPEFAAEFAYLLQFFAGACGLAALGFHALGRVMLRRGGGNREDRR